MKMTNKEIKAIVRMMNELIKAQDKDRVLFEIVKEAESPLFTELLYTTYFENLLKEGKAKQKEIERSRSR